MRKESTNNTGNLANLLLRYFSLLGIAFIISYSGIFYLGLLKITIYPVSFMLNIFTGLNSYVYNDMILSDSASIIQLIPACIAVSAYFLLLILNFTTSMNAKKRFYSILFSFLMLSLLNIARIFILSILLFNKFAYFDIVHKIFWYSLSLIMVAGVWFLTVFVFGIKNIPIYDDFKYVATLLRPAGKKR